MDVYASKIPLFFASKGEPHWAITFPGVTFYSVPKDHVSASWHRHEDKHKEQWHRYWYVGFAVIYLWDLWRVGYRENRFEREARAAE